MLLCLLERHRALFAALLTSFKRSLVMLFLSCVCVGVGGVVLCLCRCVRVTC